MGKDMLTSCQRREVREELLDVGVAGHLAVDLLIPDDGNAVD